MSLYVPGFKKKPYLPSRSVMAVFTSLPSISCRTTYAGYSGCFVIESYTTPHGLRFLTARNESIERHIDSGVDTIVVARTPVARATVTALVVSVFRNVFNGDGVGVVMIVGGVFGGVIVPDVDDELFEVVLLLESVGGGLCGGGGGGHSDEVFVQFSVTH